MERIFDALREDHDKQRAMLKELLKTEGDSKERRQIYQSLKAELKAHAVAEERFFYKPMMDDDAAIKKARHSIAEHHEIDEFLEDLDKTDKAAMDCINPNRRGQDRDNYIWIRDAKKHNLVVGTKARILYQDAEGRTRIALRFNDMIRKF